MKSKFVFALVFLICFITGPAYAQIKWKKDPEAIILTSSSLGESTDLTLGIVLGSHSNLVRDQWLEIEVEGFEIDFNRLTDDSNYSFSSNNSTLQMDYQSDFNVAYSSNRNIIRVILTSDAAYVPGDSLNITISNVFSNQKEDEIIATKLPVISVRTYNQPMFHPHIVKY